MGQLINHHDANVIGVWRTSEGYGGGEPPDVTGADLDVLVAKADELGWTFNDSGKAIGHFFARLADWDTEGIDWYPIGHQRHGRTMSRFITGTALSTRNPNRPPAISSGG